MTADLDNAQGLTIELAASEGGKDQWVELIRGGVSNARDGRVFTLSDAKAVISRSMGPGQELPIDYEHQMERPDNVGPVPAAGWIVELAARDGGIWGRVSWTARGAELVANREYRFLSPSLMVRKGTSEVRRIIGAGLVHRPALELKALAQEGPPMDRNTDPDTDQPLTLDRALLADRLGLDVADVTPDAILSALTAKPNPAEFVPMEVVKELLASQHQAQKALTEIEAISKVDAAVMDGHITPAMRPWALELCQADPESFESFVDASPAPWKHLGSPWEARPLRHPVPPRHSFPASMRPPRGPCVRSLV